MFILNMNEKQTYMNIYNKYGNISKLVSDKVLATGL